MMKSNGFYFLKAHHGFEMGLENFISMELSFKNFQDIRFRRPSRCAQKKLLPVKSISRIITER